MFLIKNIYLEVGKSQKFSLQEEALPQRELMEKRREKQTA
jgi:hypothetical protein